MDNDKADLLAVSLIYNTERLNRFTVGPSYYSVSQQLVYRLGQPRPKNLGDLRGRLAVASGSAQISELRQLKKKQYSQLSWEVSSDLGSRSLLEKVAEGTLAESATVGLLQRGPDTIPEDERSGLPWRLITWDMPICWMRAP